MAQSSLLTCRLDHTRYPILSCFLLFIYGWDTKAPSVGMDHQHPGTWCTVLLHMLCALRKMEKIVVFITLAAMILLSDYQER